jgi:hypothetical protein
MTCTFEDFQKGHPGPYIVGRVFNVSVNNLETWAELQHRILATRAGWAGGMDGWCESVRTQYGVMSTGERALLLAILFVCDYTWLADELAEGRSFLNLMEYVSGEYAWAAAACIARIDKTRPVL